MHATVDSHAPLSDLIDLSTKVAVVTGGSVGIGRAIALREPRWRCPRGPRSWPPNLASYLTGSQIVADGGLLLR